jgi:hypothetical protein
MFGITRRRSLATIVAVSAVLATATPAGAVIYNGHAGLGASYQHNQTDLEFAAAATQDGTSNTLMVGLRRGA